MKKNIMLYIFVLSLSIAYFENDAISEYNNIGKNYTMDRYYGKYLNVTFLKNDYKLEKRPNSSPDSIDGMYEMPYETDVRAYITKDNQIVQKIESLSSFENYVNIDTIQKAIEFVRFRTSTQTHFLFQPENTIEVFFNDKADKYEIGLCSIAFKKKYGIKNIEATKKDAFFEIRRFLLYVPWPESKNFGQSPCLYFVKEKVFNNGKYLIEMDYITNHVRRKDVVTPLLPR